MKVREFTTNDWSGYSGAEAPENGEPLIAQAKVNELDSDVIVDAHGIEVFCWKDNGLTNPIWYRLNCTFALGRLIVEALPEILVEEELFNLGFRKP